MKKLTFIVCIVLVITACKKQQPEDVAQSFYKFLNTNNFEKAKELSTPSAIEYIDHLKELVGNNIKGDSLEFQVMDVKKKDAPREGDTATVNYKIGNFKSYVKLVWNDGKYKVFYNEDLPSLRIVEYNPTELYNQYKKLDYQAFWNKFGLYRFRVKNLLGISFGDNLYGIPFNIENNTSPENRSNLNFDNARSFVLQYNGKNVELTGKGENTSLDLPFVLSSFNDGQDKSKITSTLPDHRLGESEIWNSTSLFTFEGVLSKVNQYHRYMYFDQCIIK